MNKHATQFIDNLKASFTQKMDDHTRSLYARRAAEYYLTPLGWKNVLDRLVEGNESGYVISWPKIKQEIEREKLAANECALGFMYFDKEGYTYAIRIKRENGRWVNACGINIGHEPKLPVGYTDKHIIPDAVHVPQSEIPDPAWIAAKVKEINANLSKIKSMPKGDNAWKTYLSRQ